MRILTGLAVFGLLSYRIAQATDFAVAPAPGGINLYATTVSGVHLIGGSPFTIQQTDAFPLTPVLTAINTKHTFAYAVYENLAFAQGGPTPLMVVGFAITLQGLEEKWSYSVNVNPEIYAQESTTLSAGDDYAVFTYTPDDSTPYFAMVFNQAGEPIIGEGPTAIADIQPISLKISPAKHYLYFCHFTGTGNPLYQEVSVYSINSAFFDGSEPPPFAPPTFVADSTDPSFVQAQCN